MTIAEKNTPKTNPARLFLVGISRKLQNIAKISGDVTVNDLLTQIYSQESDSHKWGTFNEWKQRGFYVGKGEHGFAVWSRPMSKRDQSDADAPEISAESAGQSDSQAGEPGAPRFYVAYIFCARQVASREGYTPDGERYTPSGLTPPHLRGAAPEEKPGNRTPAAVRAPQASPTPARTPAPAHQAAALRENEQPTPRAPLLLIGPCAPGWLTSSGNSARGSAPADSNTPVQLALAL